MRQCRRVNTNHIGLYLNHRITYKYKFSSFPSADIANTLQQYQHETHFPIDSEYSELFEEHASMVIPYISNRTSTKISVLRSEQALNHRTLLLRSNNDNNLQKWISQLNEFLNQDMIDIRPASLQPLMIPIIKYIRHQILPSGSDVDMFIDSYSSQIYIGGNDSDKKLAIECINKLLSINI